MRRRLTPRKFLRKFTRGVFEALEPRTVLAPADLDPTWDTDGKLVGAAGFGMAIAVQPDGKVVVGGGTTSPNRFQLFRYHPDGAVDTSFGGSGAVITDIPGDTLDTIMDLVLQPDGKIVAAGRNGTDWVVARYLSTGILDTTFGGGDGIVTLDFGGNDAAYGVALQSDGKIVVVGNGNFGTGSDLAVARLNADGTSDTSFDGDGRVVIDPGPGVFAMGYDVVVQADGKIAVGGSYGSDYIIVRYNTNGTADTTYDGDGRAFTTFGMSAVNDPSLALQADGKLLIAGLIGSASNVDLRDFAVARFTTTGSLDTTFSGDGRVITNFPGSKLDFGQDVAVQSNGKILVSGYTFATTTADFAVARYNADGSLDTTFDSDGLVTVDLGFNDTDGGEAMALQSDGRILMAGSTNSGGGLVGVVRFKGDFTGAITAVLSGGNLVVTDTDSTGKANSLTLVRSGTDLILTDTVDQFAQIPPGGVLSNGGKTLTLPAALVTGSLTVNTAGGSDLLTLDFSGGNVLPTGGLTLNGGAPATANADRLVITGGSPGAVSYNATDASSGNVLLANFGTVNYSGLEGLAIDAAPTNLSLNLPASSSTLTLGDDGTGGNNLSRLTGNNFRTFDFRSPTGTLTINRGSLTDALTVTALPDFVGGLNFGSAAAPLRTIAINGLVTLATDKSLAAFASESITTAFSGGGVAASGTGGIALTSTKGILIQGAGGLTTVNGPLTLSANQQPVASTGAFHGITLDTAVVQATGSGVVTVYGRGGTDSSTSTGIRIDGAGRITGGTSGVTTITGVGGSGSGFSSYGINTAFFSGTFSTLGSSLVMSGTGGTNGVSLGSTGLELYGATISAAGTGSVTVTGVGGQVSGDAGIAFGSSSVTTNDGDITISATGGLFGLYSGSIVHITAGGSGNLNLTGVSAGPNQVVGLSLTGVELQTAGGAITVRSDSIGSPVSAFQPTLSMTGNSLISIPPASNGTITVIADSMSLAGSISAPNGTVKLLPETSALNLGGDDGPTTLGLTDAELDVITAATLQIGDATSPAITISAEITRSAATSLQLNSSAAINFAGGSLASAGGNVALNPGTSVGVATAGVDVNAGGGTLTFGSGDDLAMVINGTTADTQHSQLSVVGTVNLTGADLALSGSQVTGDVFTLVNNDGADAVAGTFNGLPEGSILSFNGLTRRISYVGGDGNDVTLSLTTLHVVSSSLTPAGVRFQLSDSAALAALNLYDYRNAGDASMLGDADVQLTNSLGVQLLGSLVVAAGDRDFIFVPTSGVLPPDTYTLTLRGTADGVQTSAAALLDGDADGVAGGNYVRTFTIAAPPVGARVISLPHFARGPEQAVHVPADVALGLPVRISNGDQVGSLIFELNFDAGLLNVTGVTLPASAPPGSSASLTSLGAGRARVTLTFGSPLSAGAQTIAYLQATVPTTAASRYGERESLDLTALNLRNGSGVTIAAFDQDAVHVNAYLGDAGRNGRYDSFDVQQASRLAVRIDTGFQLHPLLDPTILADFNGNSRIDSFDVQRLSRLALRLPIAEAPELPNPPPTVTNTNRLAEEEPAPEKPAEKPAGPRSDVDGSGAVDAQDVLWAIYQFNRSSHGAVPADTTLKLDVNGDRQFDVADILLTITDAQAAEGEDDLAALLAADAVAARKKK